jgi:hypothetical protein
MNIMPEHIPNGSPAEFALPFAEELVMKKYLDGLATRGYSSELS